MCTYTDINNWIVKQNITSSLPGWTFTLIIVRDDYYKWLFYSYLPAQVGDNRCLQKMLKSLTRLYAADDIAPNQLDYLFTYTCTLLVFLRKQLWIYYGRYVFILLDEPEPSRHMILT